MTCRTVFTFVFLIFSLSAMLAQNWNTGSGGNNGRNGLSTEIGPETENLLWEGGLFAIIAQQAVIDGDVVAMSRISDISDVLDGTDIVAQDLSTGDFLWTATLPVEDPENDWRNRVSAIANGNVYATRSGNTNMSYMYALDINDGSILWQSEGLVDESSTESTNFREDGALVVGNNRSILCIDPEDGSTIWETARSSPTSNGQEVAIHGNKGYFWEPTPFGPEITAIELTRGERLYSSGALSAGLIQQLAPFIGPDGTVYGPRSMNNPTTDSLFAMIDTDTGFVKKWATPIGYVPFSTGGVGPDGSVYTYGRGANVIRLDAETGEILDSSEMILPGASSSPRMAIDNVGRVYVTNGEFAEGEFYVFDRHLNTLWSTPIRNVNIGGPAIGKDGTLVICGVGTDVRAYRGMPTSTLEVSEEIILEVSPNPTPDRISFDLPETASDAEFWLFDKNGRLIEKLQLDGYSISHVVDLGHLPSGTYFPIISIGDHKYRTSPVVKL